MRGRPPVNARWPEAPREGVPDLITERWRLAIAPPCLPSLRDRMISREAFSGAERETRILNREIGGIHERGGRNWGFFEGGLRGNLHGNDRFADIAVGCRWPSWAPAASFF